MIISQLGTVVRRFKRNADKSWTVTLADADNRRQKRVIKAKFIFIGAGGAALTLLQETGIPQAKEYAASRSAASSWSAKIRRW
jgi:malate dehydrogenase (quinone)